MSTALEIMKAIVDNGGPKEKDEREVCPNCGKKAWKTFIPESHSRLRGTVGCSSCRKPWPKPVAEPKTRPMNAREFAGFVGQNIGEYLYRHNEWPDAMWQMIPLVEDDSKAKNWLYAHNTEGELIWMELPQMEAE